MESKKIILPLFLVLVAILIISSAKTKASEMVVSKVEGEKVEATQKLREIENANTKLLEDIAKARKDNAIKAEQERLAKEAVKKRAKSQQVISRGGVSRGTFTITAYDDTPASQGKWVGTTATGFSLTGHTRASAMCIAVDPKVIPLGSKVKLEFDEQYSHFNGVYTAYDTGGAIKGNIIDLFMGGQGVAGEVRKFGRRKVKVTILE